MSYQYPLFALLVLLIGTSSITQAQSYSYPRYVTDPSSILHLWNFWLGAHKNVTGKYPTDFQLGKVYRLQSDVVVNHGSTSSRVTKYWINNDNVEEVKQRIRDPQAAKARDTEALRSVMPNLRFPSDGVRDGLMQAEIRRIQSQRETRTVMSAGTRLRFSQIWLEGNCENGVVAKPFAEILDGPLKGKLISIYFISDHEDDVLDHGQHSDTTNNRYQRCNVNPRYLELLGE